MTIITKPLSEKKEEKLGEPLVENVKCEPVKNGDLETGVGFDPKFLVLRRRARRASSVTTAFLFLTALLVMSCGIIAGVYLYRQFARAQMHRFRGWCRVPYDDNMNLESGALQTHFNPLQEITEQEQEDLNMFKKLSKVLAGSLYTDQKVPKADNFFREEFEIDVQNESYEKITVPDFAGGRRSRFIHDFNSNKTGIIDLDGHRCFVMPLNRSRVLPPNNLLDLVKKMWDGYYEVDTTTVRESMRVVMPPVKDTKKLGPYIERECSDYPVYLLEKVVPGVVKRSAEQQAKFRVFSGEITEEFDIVDFYKVLNYEAQRAALES